VPMHNHVLGFARVVPLAHEWGPAVDHLVENDANTPPVTQLGVSLNIWGKVIWLKS
jgi:hypothetical protein